MWFHRYASGVGSCFSAPSSLWFGNSTTSGLGSFAVNPLLIPASKVMSVYDHQAVRGSQGLTNHEMRKLYNGRNPGHKREKLAEAPISRRVDKCLPKGISHTLPRGIENDAEPYNRSRPEDDWKPPESEIAAIGKSTVLTGLGRPSPVSPYDV